MKNLKSFLEQNSFVFDERNSPRIRPDHILSTLQLGLNSYYSTYHSDIDSISSGYFYKIIPGVDESRAFINPAIGCSHEYLAHYFSAVSYTQLFFELYIVKLLDAISPVITRKHFTDSHLLKELANQAQDIDYSVHRTRQYSTIVNRLKILLTSESGLPEQYQIEHRFRFLKDHLEVLESLPEWRNKILHSGKQVLFRYAFELLFVNFILPIAKEVVSLEKDAIPMNRNLNCGLNVIRELCSIKLPFDYLNVATYSKTKEQLNRINHLKELGRASMNNQLYMGEWGTETERENIERHVNVPKRELSEREAEVMQEVLGYHERFTCPCCGTQTLMTYEYWTETANGRTRPNKAKCIQCTYMVDLRIGEPIDYGIMNETIFNYLD